MAQKLKLKKLYYGYYESQKNSYLIRVCSSEYEKNLWFGRILDTTKYGDDALIGEFCEKSKKEVVEQIIECLNFEENKHLKDLFLK